jgi:hypothetical protein
MSSNLHVSFSTSFEHITCNLLVIAYLYFFPQDHYMEKMQGVSLKGQMKWLVSMQVNA